MDFKHETVAVYNRPVEQLVVTFDEPTARGTVVLRECAYGLELILPDVSPFPVGVIDFFYASPEMAAESPAGPPAQIIVHSPAQTDDPVGRVRFFPARTVVDFELGVCAEYRTPASREPACYGYPPAKYPPVEQLVHHRGVRVFRALAADGTVCPTWFTTDPDRANLAQDGPHFRLDDVTVGPAESTDARHSRRVLCAVLTRAIDAGRLTPAGLDCPA